MRTQLHIRVAIGLLLLKISLATILLQYNELESQFYALKTGNYIPEKDPLDDLSENEKVALCDEFINATTYINTTNTSQSKTFDVHSILGLRNYQRLLQQHRYRNVDVSMEEADTLQLHNTMVIRGFLVPPFKTFLCVKMSNKEWHLAYGLGNFVHFVLTKDTAISNLFVLSLMDSNPVRTVLRTSDEGDIMNALEQMSLTETSELPSICDMQSHIRYHLCGVVHDIIIKQSWPIQINYSERAMVLHWQDHGAKICMPRKVPRGDRQARYHVYVPSLSCVYDRNYIVGGYYMLSATFFLILKSIQGDIVTVAVYADTNFPNAHIELEKIGEISVKSILHYWG